MRLRKREKINPIHVYPQDTIKLTYTDSEGNRQVVLEEEAGRELRLTEAAIFDVEATDFEGATGGIGGAFLETRDARVK